VTYEVIVFTDHANLQYYHQPYKINHWVACYIPCLAEYSYKLIHKPRKCNKADHLSRCPDYDQGKDNNQDVLVLPDSVFVCTVSLSFLEQCVFDAQLLHLDLLASWHALYPHVTIVDSQWFHCHVPIVVADNALKWEVLTQYHDHPLAGHPGIFKTYLLVS
jgi:Integrase zinc binding domain